MKVFEVINWAKRYLEEKRREDTYLDAQILLSYVLNLSKGDLYLIYQQEIRDEEISNYQRVIKRRGEGEPVAYITGYSEFMSLKFVVNPQVFIPRAETEVLVERVAERVQNAKCKIQNKGITIVDLGTGSGCIAVSLARLIPKVKIYALDISSEALAIALLNAKEQKVEDKITFLQGDLLKPLKRYNLEGRVDVFASNPPYIPQEEIKDLPLEVQFEPEIALDGGKGGLYFYKETLPEVKDYLSPEGFLALEVGMSQARDVLDLCSKSGLEENLVFKDYAGIERVVVAYR